MAASEPGLGTRILGDRWSVADGTPKPAWVQIEEQLADRIEAGALAPGDRLPPERDLAQALGVSRMTVRQALASLAARGLVERGVGRGTFVREGAPVDHDLTRVAGFTARGRGPGPGGGRADPVRPRLRRPGPRRARPGPRARAPRCCGSSGSGSAAAGR